MNNKIIDFYKTILEKKFAKKREAGYNPEEVDKFLDEILIFIKILNLDFKSLIETIKKIENENNLLKNNIAKKESENIILESRINDILKDGYYSHQMRKELSELKKKVNGK